LKALNTFAGGGYTGKLLEASCFTNWYSFCMYGFSSSLPNTSIQLFSTNKFLNSGNGTPWAVAQPQQIHLLKAASPQTHKICVQFFKMQ
jgi:hypothetical protein